MISDFFISHVICDFLISYVISEFLLSFISWEHREDFRALIWSAEFGVGP